MADKHASTVASAQRQYREIMVMLFSECIIQFQSDGAGTQTWRGHFRFRGAQLVEAAIAGGAAVIRQVFAEQGNRPWTIDQADAGMDIVDRVARQIRGKGRTGVR